MNNGMSNASYQEPLQGPASSMAHDVEVDVLPPCLFMDTVGRSTRNDIGRNSKPVPSPSSRSFFSPLLFASFEQYKNPHHPDDNNQKRKIFKTFHFIAPWSKFLVILWIFNI